MPNSISKSVFPFLAPIFDTFSNRSLEKVGPISDLRILFEPFFQVDGSPTRAQGGTGVGLAVARGVARGHGGDLTLTSPCDLQLDGVKFGGACFTLSMRKKPRSDLAGS